ncbi:unnamed protein product [Haemonchus placei]|uniref:Uncharacterized protein n=1 Tax=Haemonchus placei TaxID=6290 RepID=A0A0N4WMX8_HAEPC|nr:unnamed protein product [Haemonchus placei]
MKVMHQDEMDMMKVIHADLPAHLQSVVRIEGDNVFINEAGFRCLPSSTTSALPFSRFPSSAVPHAMCMNPGTVPPVDMPPFIAAPGIPPVIPSRSIVSSMPPSMPSDDVKQCPYRRCGNTNPESAPPAIASTTAPPPNAALPLNMNVPPPNVQSGSERGRQRLWRTLELRTYVSPGIGLIGNFSPPLNAHDNDGSGEVDWTSGPRVFQYRSEPCYDKRQGTDMREFEGRISIEMFDFY